MFVFTFEIFPNMRIIQLGNDFEFIWVKADSIVSPLPAQLFQDHHNKRFVQSELVHEYSLERVQYLDFNNRLAKSRCYYSVIILTSGCFSSRLRYWFRTPLHFLSKSSIKSTSSWLKSENFWAFMLGAQIEKIYALFEKIF